MWLVAVFQCRIRLGFQIAGELTVNDPFGPGVQFKLKGLLPDQKSLKVHRGGLALDQLDARE